RWNLMVVKRHEDVLRIPAVDPLAISIEHIGIEKVRPGIDLPTGIDLAAASNHTLAAAYGHVQPDFVAVGRALREGMTHLQRAHHHPEDVALPRLQLRQLGS